MSTKFNMDIDLRVFEGGSKRPRTEFNIENDLSGKVSFDDLQRFLKATLLQISYEVLREEQGRGFDKNPIVRVDNVLGKPPSQVSPFGKIEFASRIAPSELFIETYRQIIERSPVGQTGLYSQYNLVLVNGNLVARNIPELQAFLNRNRLKDGDVIKYINLTPYAGRLERLGKRKGGGDPIRGLSRKKRQAAKGVKVNFPNGAYFLAFRQVRRKFGINTKIYFEFTSGRNYLNSAKLTGRQPGRNADFRTDFSPRSRYKGPYVYPTIRIVYNERGFV